MIPQVSVLSQSRPIRSKLFGEIIPLTCFSMAHRKHNYDITIPRSPYHSCALKGNITVICVHMLTLCHFFHMTNWIQLNFRRHFIVTLHRQTTWSMGHSHRKIYHKKHLSTLNHKLELMPAEKYKYIHFTNWKKSFEIQNVATVAENFPINNYCKHLQIYMLTLSRPRGSPLTSKIVWS